MWPDSFSDWWPLVAQRIYERVYQRMRRYRLLSIDGRSEWRVERFARQAVRAVFDRADMRQGFAGHFVNATDFRRWAVQCGHLEALRLLPAQELVQPWIEQLPLDSRRVLLWAYLDQFDERGMAAALSDDQSLLTARLARDRVLSAYRELCDLLRANDYGADDDGSTFPVPPILFAVG